MKYIMLVMISIGVVSCAQTPNGYNDKDVYLDAVGGSGDITCQMKTNRQIQNIKLPKTVQVTSQDNFLKVDCHDISTGIRRSFDYQDIAVIPSALTFNFRDMNAGYRYNGFRDETGALTEKSYSHRVLIDDDTMVNRRFVMDSRNMPKSFEVQ